MRSWWVALFLCASISAAAADDSLVSIGDATYLSGTWTGGKISYLRYPTLGCPALVQPGASGKAFVKLPDGGLTTGFELSLSPVNETGATAIALPITSILYDAAKGLYTLAYSMPATAPPCTYDVKLSIPSASIADIQHNSLRVVAGDPSTWTFVVLSDSHFNDPRGILHPRNYNAGSYTVWNIIQQMKKELRTLNPTFAIITGDIVFGLDYDYEYEGAWNLWKDTGLPVFMVPGNHDSYACVKERHFLGITSPKRDGLDYWRKYWGPQYYSFDFGGVHFQGVNSADGTPERRDGFLIIIENYGGDLLPEQQAWIAADLAATSKPVIPYMHHDPLGPYTPNKPFDGVSAWILEQIWKWITTGSIADFSQVWNTEATGAFLLSAYNGPAQVAFIGHEHHDDIKTYGATTYKLVTTSGSDGKGYWGYARVKVVDTAVVEYLYQDSTHQSVPAGNLIVTHTTPNDGTGTLEKATLTSGLSKSYPATIEFRMAAAPAYAATGGTVVQTAPLTASSTRVWVSVTTPVAPDVTAPVTVNVSVSTASVPTAVGSSVAASPSPTTPAGAGLACGASSSDPGSWPGTLLLLILPLVLLGWARYNSSR